MDVPNLRQKRLVEPVTVALVAIALLLDKKPSAAAVGKRMPSQKAIMSVDAEMTALVPLKGKPANVALKNSCV